MEDEVSIYELVDPITLETRYIGKTNNTRQRLRDHLHDKKINHRTNWINLLKSKNRTPILNVIDTVRVSEWEFWERWWIELYKSWNINLTNSTLGGDSGPIRRGIENGMYGKTHTVEARRRISQKKKLLVGDKHPQYGKVSPLKGKSYAEIVGARKSLIMRQERSEAMKRIRKERFPRYIITDSNNKEYFNDCGLYQYCKKMDFHYWTFFGNIGGGKINKKKQRYHINWEINLIKEK